MSLESLVSLKPVLLVGVSAYSIYVTGLSNLTTLCLADITGPNVPSCRSIIEVIRSSPRLEKLKIDSVDCQTFPAKDDATLGSPEAVVNLPFLKCLTLYWLTPTVLDYILANINTENFRSLKLGDRRSQEWDDDFDPDGSFKRGNNIMRHLTRPFPNGESMLSKMFKGPWSKGVGPVVDIFMDWFPLLFNRNDKRGMEDHLEVCGEEEWAPQIVACLEALKESTLSPILQLHRGFFEAM